MSKHAAQLRALLQQDRLLVAPGAYDGLSARLVARAGFEAVYASGGAMARAAALPDLNLMSLKEVADQVERLCDAVDLPVIADGDTGHGGALNVHRTVTLLRRAGAAALHIEDQVYPKRCGHYDDKGVVPTAEMLQRLRAARHAADDIVLIARTDALAVEPFEAVMERAQRYMEAGADMIFVEAPCSLAEIERIAAALPYPKLINMFHGGKTPLVPAAKLEKLGYRLMIVPSDLQRAAIGAMRRALAAIARDGSSAAVQGEMVSFADREAIVGTKDYLARDKGYAGD
ncbi:MAG TPA: isocitrate lyase/PEP mutase family protein [Kiloniellales bacterium]|nr:isocitrate lyase/PEP mutase family protein [Kiloniellales bacterium]